MHSTRVREAEPSICRRKVYLPTPPLLTPPHSTLTSAQYFVSCRRSDTHGMQSTPSHRARSRPPPLRVPADIDGLTWTKLPQSCALRIRQAKGSTLAFIGFRDQVRCARRIQL